MLVIFANDQINLNQQEYRISDLVNNISTLSGQQLADFFATRKIPLLREIRIQALRYVLNQKLINSKNLGLTDQQKHTLSKFPYLSEYQLEQFFPLLADDVAFVQYKKKLVELIILNNTALELTDNELIQLNQTYSINPSENFTRFQKALSKGVIDNPTHFDGLRYDRFKVVANHTMTDEDLIGLAEKYDIMFTVPLQKDEIMKFIINDLMEKKLWKDNQYEKLAASEINELDSFAALKSIKISSTLRREELIAYLLKKRKYTRAYAHNSYLPIQLTDDLKKFKMPADAASYLKNNSISPSKMKEFAKEIDKTEFTRRQIDGISKEIDAENNQISEWNKFLLSKGLDIPAPSNVASVEFTPVNTTPITSTPVTSPVSTPDVSFQAAAPQPDMNQYAGTFSNPVDTTNSNSSASFAGASAFDALNLSSMNQIDPYANNGLDAFTVPSNNDFDSAYASAFGGQSQDTFGQQVQNFNDSFQSQTFGQDPYANSYTEDPYANSYTQDPYASNYTEDPYASSYSQDQYANNYTQDQYANSYAQEAYVENNYASQEPQYGGAYQEQQYDPYQQQVTNSYQSFDQGYNSLQNELNQMADQMRRTQADFRNSMSTIGSPSQNASKTQELLVRQYNELLMASETASQLNQQTINNYERKLAHLESQLNNYDAIAASRLANLKNELERTRMQAIDTESSLRKEIQMTHHRYYQNEEMLRNELENQKRYGVDHLLILEEKLKSEKRQRLLYERMLSRNGKVGPSMQGTSFAPNMQFSGQGQSMFGSPTQSSFGGGYPENGAAQMYNQNQMGGFGVDPYAAQDMNSSFMQQEMAYNQYGTDNMMDNSLYSDPYASGFNEQMGGFGADSFGSVQADPGFNDPFGMPATPGFNDPFGAVPNVGGLNDSFGGAQGFNDPFGMPATPGFNDPFGAPATPGFNDPFGAPATPGFNDPFSPVGNPIDSYNNFNTFGSNNDPFNLGSPNPSNDFGAKEANMSTAALRSGDVPSLSINPALDSIQNTLTVDKIETNVPSPQSDTDLAAALTAALSPESAMATSMADVDSVSANLENKISGFNADELDADYDELFKKKKNKFKILLIITVIALLLIPLIIGILYEIFDDINVIISIYEMLSPFLGFYMNLGRQIGQVISNILG